MNPAAAPPSPAPPPPGSQPVGAAALVLLGGGARTAYQVGVLGGMLDALDAAGLAPERNPFAIVCGTSAGALNAAFYAAGSDRWRDTLCDMQRLWSELAPHDVFHTGAWPLAAGGARWLALFAFGWLLHQSPRSLLDNTPLIGTLQRTIAFDRIQTALDRGALRALSVAASSYTTGRHITFFQSADAHPGWRRPGQWGVPARIGIDHLLASAALPFIFPAVALPCADGLDYFGDGAMRQLSPLAPAIQLGAQRILAIGVAEPRPTVQGQPHAPPPYPSVAQIAGHAMSSIFLDTLRADAQQADRINAMLGQLPPALRARLPLRLLPVLTVLPSQSISAIAARHWATMPRLARALLEGVGTGSGTGAMLASYLLFTTDYLRELIDLGRADALAQRDQLLRFFAPACA